MTGPYRNLDSLPYDVFYQIVTSLDYHDFNNLARVNRAIDSQMRNDRLAKRAVENHLSHTKEGRVAQRGTITFRQAIGRLLDRKEAVALARPYSAAILSYAATFIYQEGVLCYIYANEIRVLDVHQGERVEHVLNVRNILRRIIPGFKEEEAAGPDIQLSLLHYSAGVLAILVEIYGHGESWLIALDVTPQGHKLGRVRLRRQLLSSRRLFVRHDGSYLFYGTHSNLGRHGHNQWIVQGVNLKTGKNLTAKPIVLEDFAGHEIGHTICFEVFQSHLYAVSNLVYFAAQEVDFTSFYVWACIPPTPDVGRPPLHKTWRRQHIEGPINDSWMEMSLREDEATGRLTIFECRREWPNGQSENLRTYYIRPLPFPAEVSSEAALAETVSSTRPSASLSSSDLAAPLMPSNMLLPNSPLVMALDEGSRPNYAEPERRLPRHIHPEYDEDSRRHDFILTKTKYRTYNPSASAFLDLVNDDRGQGRTMPQDRLRVRISSRKRRYPFDDDVPLIAQDVSPSGELIEWSEERFVSRGIYLWPSDDAPQEVNDLLCPTKRATGIMATADERSLVYSVDTEDSNLQAIILISFDPQIRIPSMRRLAEAGTNLNVQPSRIPVGIDRPLVGDMNGRARSVSLGAGEAAGASYVSSFRSEPAMHLSINRGYWLR